MTYEAILFDLDGVVIDTRQSVTDFWLAVAAEEGVTLTPADFVRDIYGCTANYTLDKLFPAIVGERRQAFHRRIDSYEAALIYETVPGVADLLGALKRAGVPTALATSANQGKVGVVLGQLGLQEAFTARVTVEDIQRSKPDPDCYLKAAESLGVAPGRCVVFEDAVNGMKAAVAAGTTGIGVQPLPDVAAALIEVGASRVVPDFRAVMVDGTAGSMRLRVDGGEALNLTP